MTPHLQSGLALLVLATMGLTACGEPAQTPADQAAPPAPPTPMSSSVATDPPPGESLPPKSDEEPRYVGRWAAASTACGHEAWRFEAGGLHTPGEVACTFDKVTAVKGGYDVAMHCAAEAPPAASTLRLRFVEGAAKGMLVEGGPFSGAVGLIYCGR